MALAEYRDVAARALADHDMLALWPDIEKEQADVNEFIGRHPELKKLLQETANKSPETNALPGK